MPAAGPYVPLTAGDKFHIFVQHTYSPYTFANTGFNAAWAQMTDTWPAYGQGMQGYGKRYGALLADEEAGIFFHSFLFPTVLHQDPRYFRLGDTYPLTRRIAYAASRMVVTRADSGHETLNFSFLMAAMLCATVKNAYYPRPERGFDRSATRFEGSLLSSAQTNLLREFWPDMMRVFRRHEPARIKKLEQKIPLADKLDPGAKESAP